MYDITEFSLYTSFLIGLLTFFGILASCVKFRHQRKTKQAFTQTEEDRQPQRQPQRQQQRQQQSQQQRQTRYISTQTEVIGRTNRDSQTDLKGTKTVQTETMRFTERITNFDMEHVNSSEIFDNCCEICVPILEKEAVGFCKVCEKFMCLNCCKHHKKIPLSKSHALLGKENYQKAKEKIPKIENHLAPVQTYDFQSCWYEQCVPKPLIGCRADHFIQPYGLANSRTSGEICCILQRYSYLDGHRLSLRYQDNATGTVYNSDILQDCPEANDFCTTKDNSNEILEEVCSNGIYFTVPKATTVWKYECTKCNTELQKKGPITSYTNFETIKGKTTRAFYKNGQCYGIAAFDNGLAISLFITTSYAVPDWQVQYVTFTGTVKQQIYYDSEGQPLFKEPKYLTSNDAQNVLYVSDQSAHSIIALDPKGTVLFKFTHESVKCPQGLTCDDEENIYVACENKVIQIDQHGTKSRIILSPNEKKPNILIDVCFNEVSHKLAVVNKSAEVTVFKFLP